MEDLRGDLDHRVLRYHLRRDLDAVHNLDSCRNDRIVLHVGHADEVVDLRDSEEVQGVGHESLETSILHSSNLLRTAEVSIGRISSFLTFARVVDQVFGHLAEGSTFLSVVDDDAASTPLRRFDTLLNRMRQVRPAGTDIASKDVTAIAFVVHSAGQLDILVGDGIRIAPDVDRQPSDRWEKDLDIRTCNELGIHTVGHSELS